MQRAVATWSCLALFSLSLREDELRAALAAHEEVDVLQRLCEGRKIPADLRLALWKVRDCPFLSHKPPHSHTGVSGSVPSTRYHGDVEWTTGLRGAGLHPYPMPGSSRCVCVCERERERESVTSTSLFSQAAVGGAGQAAGSPGYGAGHLLLLQDS